MAKGALSTAASGYALGVLASGLALAIALLLRPVFEANPFLSFFAAIAVSARYGGLGSAILATALGGLASTYFFLHPLYSFGLGDAVTALRLTGYFAVAGIICGLSELWRRERRRVELLAIDEQQARTEAEAAAARFRALTETMASAIFLHRGDRLLYANPAAALLTGFSLAELREMSAMDLVHPDSHRDVFQIAEARMRGESGLSRYEIKLRTKSGETRWTEISSELFDYDGQPTVLVTAFGIDERKRAELALRFLASASNRLSGSLDYETTLRSVVELVVPELADYCAIHVLEPSGEIRPAAANHVDPSKLEPLWTLVRQFPPRPDSDTPAARALRTGRSELGRLIEADWLATVTRDDEQLRLTRELRPQSFVVAPLLAQGRPVGVLTCIMAESGRRYDEADRALLENLAGRCAQAVENARLYQQVQEAVQARNTFLSVAAHELKTPITSLYGFAQIAVRQLSRTGTLDSNRAERVLRGIEEQSLKLNELAAQLLDLSRIDSGKLVLNPVETNLVVLVEGLARTAQERVGDHRIVTQTDGSVMARVDALRFEQVLTNLLDNAVKYSPEDSQIDVEVRKDPAGSAQVAVRDRGLGIPEERRHLIFDRFYQAHESGYRGGMGLGLYISRQIVELHGGTIQAEAPTDGGTRIVITLPAAADEAVATGRTTEYL